MNQIWKTFLLTQKATFESDAHITFPMISDGNDKKIYPIEHLAILKISGNDAGKLLQGQVTCNINDITESKSSLGALCNPKGRAISTFLLVKTPDAFLMVLPKELLATIQKRLQMYILRSAVTLTDCTEKLCLLGLSQTKKQDESLFDTSKQDFISVNFSVNECRHLIIAETDKAINIWSEYVNNQKFLPTSSEQWRYLDILSGLPWLTTETTEEFIPQMLNLDQLGGISYNKGCYTGQEIVARTHYLGKTKRALFPAECITTITPAPNSTIIDISTGTEQTIAKVLLAQQSTVTTETNANSVKMLIVLQLAENQTYKLTLNDDNRTQVTLLTQPL
jgi:folate-binding protein YgfZ